MEQDPQQGAPGVGPTIPPQYPGMPGQQPPTNYPAYPAYPAQPGGYPPQPGYPPQQGYPPQPGYPSQPSYPLQPGYPQPGYPPQFQPPKQRGNAGIIAGVIAGVVALALIITFVAVNNHPSGSISNNGNTLGHATSTSAQSSSQHNKVGDPVTVANTYVVTVNSVTTSNGDDVTQPQAGDTFVVVDVTVKNISSTEQDLFSFAQFTFRDTTGQQYEEAFLINATTPDGKVESGDQIRGQIPYEAPASVHAFTLAFQADPFSSGQTIWDLTV